METKNRTLEEIAKEYALTLIDEQFLDGSPQYVCFLAGLRESQSTINELRQENERLKADYEGMSGQCRYLIEINVFNMAFDEADSEWRKQHSVNEGENFIDWYMRYHAAEREADRKTIQKLQETLSKVKR